MDSLMLIDVLQALEQQGHIVAFDMGEHMRCYIDSNCPRAVELRKILSGMGIDYKTLKVDHEPSSFMISDGDFQPITATVMIGNTEIDASTLIREEAVQGLRNLVNRAENAHSHVRRLGAAYNSTYNNRVAELRKQGRLPQLPFSLADMVRYDCRITTDPDGRSYLMCFGIIYQPQWTYHDGYRYSIATTYAEQLKRNVWLVFKISKDRTIPVVRLVTSEGNKFVHYHGGDTLDCWGQNEMPHKWDGTLRQLGDKAFSLSRSLATVNMDSLMRRDPPGFPLAAELQKHSKKMGIEGQMDTPEPVAATAVPARWGMR